MAFPYVGVHGERRCRRRPRGPLRDGGDGLGHRLGARQRWRTDPQRFEKKTTPAVGSPTRRSGREPREASSCLVTRDCGSPGSSGGLSTPDHARECRTGRAPRRAWGSTPRRSRLSESSQRSVGSDRGAIPSSDVFGEQHAVGSRMLELGGDHDVGADPAGRAVSVSALSAASSESTGRWSGRGRGPTHSGALSWARYANDSLRLTKDVDFDSR